MLRKLVVTVKCVGEENIDAKRCPGVGYRLEWSIMSVWIAACVEGEEAQVDGAFMRNISSHSDIANGSVRNGVGEPGNRGSDPGMSRRSTRVPC
jgi:hypothetical protein